MVTADRPSSAPELPAIDCLNEGAGCMMAGLALARGCVDKRQAGDYLICEVPAARRFPECWTNNADLRISVQKLRSF
jgi:hypothetical protein